MDFEKMGYRNLYQDIIRQILDKLEEKKLLIGDRLPPERELAETIGVSRSTLREAFRVLEQQGIISTKPGDGRYIIGLPKPDLQAAFENIEQAAIWDLLEARETLETRIVELACERATESDFIHIKEAEELFCLQGDNADSDRAFHLSIANATHNVMFACFIRINLDLLGKIRAKTLSSPKRVAQVAQEHRLIREALEARDKEAAKQAQQMHLRNIKLRIKETEKAPEK